MVRPTLTVTSMQQEKHCNLQSLVGMGRWMDDTVLSASNDETGKYQQLCALFVFLIVDLTFKLKQEI